MAANTTAEARTPLEERLFSYIELGFSVLPIHGIKDGKCMCRRQDCGKNAGKHPLSVLVPNGFKDATRDAMVVREWITRAPGCNWAIVTGTKQPDGSYLIVLDVDPRNGGDESLLDLPSLPSTATVRTGGGGQHYYFRSLKPVASHVAAPGLDVKGCGPDNGPGGYVMVEPSGHLSGGRYEWEGHYDVSDTPLADVPDWMADGGASTRPRPVWDGASALNSLLGEAFVQAGWIGMDLPQGRYAVHCPWASLHSDDRGKGGDSSTAILPPTPDSAFGGFKCQHEHCRKRTWKDVLEALPADSVRKARIKFGPRPAETSAEPSPGKPAHMAIDEETTGGLAPDEQQRIREFLLFTQDKRGKHKIVHDLANACAVLQHDPRWKGVLKFDAFSNTLMAMSNPPWFEDERPKGFDLTYPSAWSDSDTTRLKLWFQRFWSLKLSNDTVFEAVLMTAQANGVHPVREYLNSLVWDGIPRIETWLTEYMHVEENEYSRAVGKMWLISAIARIFDPGCKVDTVLILEGTQGIRKSTALRILGGEWFSDTPFDLGSKDAYLAIQGKWIVELAELDALNRSEASKAKAFFSSASDTYRPPYGRLAVTVPRQCVFAGTVNHSQYLRDETGNRRFWPVQCGETVEIDKLKADRDQLWAEARDAYRKGDLWHVDHINRPLRERIESEQASREMCDPWEAELIEWTKSEQCLDIQRRGNGQFYVQDVLKYFLRMEPGTWTHSDMVRVGRCLSRIAHLRKERGRLYDGSVGRIWAYKTMVDMINNER